MTRRGAAISRAFALGLVLLIVSPFTAPFATFDLMAVVEMTEGGAESTKVIEDVVLAPLFVSFETTLTPCLPVPVSIEVSECHPALQTVLRI